MQRRGLPTIILPRPVIDKCPGKQEGSRLSENAGKNREVSIDTAENGSQAQRRNWQNYLRLPLDLWLPIVTHTFLTIIFTWPLVLQFGTRGISARSADLYQNLWNLWWFKTALFEQGKNPFTTDLLFYPNKPTLYLHAFNPLADLLSSPLQAVFGLTVAYNLLILVFLVAGGWASYRLARYLDLRRSGALLASVVFVYSPVISSQLDMGQLEQIMLVWLPLYILNFLEALQAKTARIFKINASLSALWLLCAALTTWYYALDLLIFAGLAGLGSLLLTFGKRGWRDRFFNLIGIGIINGIALVPLLYLTLKAIDTTPTLPSRASSVLYNSATPALFFWPGDSLLWFSNGLEGQEYSQFLGYIALTLVVIGIISEWRSGAAAWVGIFVFLVVFSLGPVVKTGLDSYTGIELPGGWLQKLPVAGSFFRVPVRLLNFAMLPFGMLAGMGLERVLRLNFLQKPDRSQTQWETRNLERALRPNFLAGKVTPALLVTTLLIGLVFVEYAPGERQTKSLELNRQLWQQVSSGVVLNLPATRVEGEAMYAQTIHRRPMISGYLARRPDFDFDKNAPVLRELLQTDFSRFIVEPYFDNTLLPLLNVYGVKYFVVYRDKLEPEQSKLLDEVLQPVVNPQTLLGKDGAAEIYRVPEYQWKVQPETGWVIYEKGWYGEESNPGLQFYRWAANESSLMLVNPNPKPLRFRLNWTLFSYEQARQISLELNGFKIGQKEANSTPEKQSFELELPPGYSLLNLKADKPAQRPTSDKNRLLGFAVGEVKLEPVQP